MKIGTDFSGIGSPEMALRKLGVDHTIEFACEIDKYARESYKAIYGEPKRFYEDITKRNHKEVDQLDLYVAGFPCQAFSIAGKRGGFEDTRGTLFFNVAEFIKENQPKTFILENVKGLLSHDNGKTFQTIVSVLSDNGGTVNGQMSVPYYDDGLGYHIYYQVLNTKDYGIPQNRERIFIVGFKEPRNFRFPKAMKLELKLKDMLEDEVDEKYFLSDKMIDWITQHREKRGSSNKFPLDEEDNASCLNARYYKCGAEDQYIKVKSATARGYEEAKDGDSVNLTAINSTTRRGRVGKQVAQTLDTLCEQGVVYSKYEKEIKQSIKQDVCTTIDASYYKGFGVRQGKCRQVVKADTWGAQIRRLTPLECWRLQGYPDDAFYKAEKVCSDTRLYQQAGNSITVDVMQKIIENII